MRIDLSPDTFPVIDLDPDERKSNVQIAREVMAGKWGNGNMRKSLLIGAGYDYFAIQNLVNRMVSCDNSPAMEPREVIYNPPATIVNWMDGTKTVVKCNDDDTYDRVTGLALCFMKKACGNTGRYKKYFKKFNANVPDEHIEKAEEPFAAFHELAKKIWR